MEPKDREIGEHTYRVTPFGCGKAMRMADAIKSAVAPALEAAITGMGRSDAAMAAGLIAKMNFAAIYSIGADFAEHTKVLMGTNSSGQGVPVPLAKSFDAHFAGRLDELIEFVVFGFLVNYESSIARGKDLGGRLKAMTAHLLPSDPSEASPSPTTSTGPSNGSSSAGGTT